jgi:hypothetical protein
MSCGSGRVLAISASGDSGDEVGECVSRSWTVEEASEWADLEVHENFFECT